MKQLAEEFIKKDIFNWPFKEIVGTKVDNLQNAVNLIVVVAKQ